jgi:hypothetical protein
MVPTWIGVYFRVNPVPPEFVGSANNKDVLRRRWLYIDVDPVKSEGHKDDPATNEEKAATKAVCEAVNDYLAGHGWPAPAITDSGNGYGLFYRCDLPNDVPSRNAFRTLLKVLAEKFSNSNGSIDKSVHNANRLAKLPGTWARKGVASESRPHRPCRLVSEPKLIESVTAEQLTAAAGPPPPDLVPRQLLNGFHHKDFAPSRAYVQKALDGECARVVLAKPGAEEGRNNALYKAAANLGELIGGGALDRDEAENSLYAAACSSGLDTDPGCGERGIWDTIRRGIDKGKQEPRGVPEPRADPTPVFGERKAAGKTGAAGPNPSELFWSMVIDGEVIAEGPPAEILPARQTSPAAMTRTFDLYTLAGLMQTQFPEPVWVIPNMLSDGLNILAGKPKMGKSMMAMNMAITVAAGGKALGNIDTPEGDVLYISLEDRTRRIQARARKMLKGVNCPVSKRLTVAAEWPRQGDGGLEMIEWWVKRVEKPTLCIIDVWGKFRPAGNPRANAYSQDYEHMSPLKDLMDKYSCCGLALMHCRKGASEDVVEDVSGTLGIAGAADGIIVLQRSRNDNEAKIFITGRDVPDSELALRFDPESLVWTNLGDAGEHVSGKLQKKIMDFLGERRGMSVRTADIGAGIGEDPNNLRQPLDRMFQKGIVHKITNGNVNSWSVPGRAGAAAGPEPERPRRDVDL